MSLLIVYETFIVPQVYSDLHVYVCVLRNFCRNAQIDLADLEKQKKFQLSFLSLSGFADHMLSAQQIQAIQRGFQTSLQVAALFLYIMIKNLVQVSWVGISICHLSSV